MSSKSPPVIVHVVHSLEGGGTERTLVSLLRAFDPSSLRHLVVTLRRAGPLAAELPDHVPCRPIGAVGRSYSAWLKLAGATRTSAADVIHARNTGCWNDAIAAGLVTPRVRLVLGFHGLETARRFDWRRRGSAHWGLRAKARFTSVSQAGARQLHEQGGVPQDRIDVLPNGVELRKFAPNDRGGRRRVRETFKLDDQAFVVGVVGSLTPVKQHATLIRAVAQAVPSVPEIHLLIVGDGPLGGQLLQQARREGIEKRVHFAGWRSDVATLLAAMDAYVCCSEAEGMSNALLEAMAAGLPIIATDVGDNARVVGDNIAGIIAPPREPQAIAGALRLLARKPHRRRRLAAAARARVEAYDFNKTVRAYEQYYQTLLGRDVWP